MSDARRETPRDIAGRLHSAAIHLLRAARTVDAESGLSPARLSAMSVLVFGGPRTLGGLAEVEGVRSPTMTQLVNGLEAGGLVRRCAVREDGRRVVVEATPAGRRLLRKAQDRRLDVLIDLLATASEEELDLLDRASEVLDRLTGDRGRA